MTQSRDFNYSLRFAGVDKLTGPLKSIRKQIGSTNADLRKLRAVERDFGRFATLRQNSQKTQSALNAAKVKTAELGREIAQNPKPTKKMSAEFKKARAEIAALRSVQSKEIEELSRLGASLKKAGYNTANFKAGQKDLKTAIFRTSKELEQHRRELKRVGDAYDKQKAARAKYRESLQTSANLGIIGAAGVTVGTRTLRGTFDLVQTVRPLEAAIGELQSLGVENLQVYRDQAARTDAQLAYTTADSFIRAAYDIRSGMSGLTDQGVASITNLSLIAARATKAEAEQMTSLTATAYGIFRNQYSELSDIEWGEQFTAGLAASVRAYKTNGSEMQRAIESARGGAALLGMDMREELAILGTLQTSMKGAEAGTALKSYAANAAKAHEAFEDMGVNIRVLNADGMLRETQSVMNDIRAHYGTLDAIEMAEIKKAFGTDEAATLINGLIDNQATFNAGFSQITNGMKDGRKFLDDMAALTDGNEDAAIQNALEEWQAMKRDFGYALIPVFKAILPPLKKITSGLSHFAREHKTLVGILGAGIVIFGALAAIMGGITIAMASMLGPLAMLRFGQALLGGQSLGLIRALKPLGGLFKNLARFAIPLLITGIRSLGLALMTTPIGWIIGGIALVGTAAYLLYKNFDKVKAGLGKSWAFIRRLFAWTPIGTILQSFGPAFRLLRALFDGAAMAAGWAWGKLKAVFTWSPRSDFNSGLFSALGAASLMIFGPITAARQAWGSLKQIFAWSPGSDFNSGLFSALGAAKLMIFGPLFAARQAWASLKKILGWSPLATLKSSWAGFKSGFFGLFDQVAKNAGLKLDWIEKKIARITGAPRRIWQKFKGVGGNLRGQGKAAGLDTIRAARGGASSAAILARPAVMTPGPAYTSAASRTQTTQVSNRYDIAVHAGPGMNEQDIIDKLGEELDRRENNQARAASNSLHDLD